jgi:hypothetical protein
VYRRFAQGSVAAMAGSAASHWLDVIKVRLQVAGSSGGANPLGPFSMGKHIVQTEGVGGLFKGLSASLLRQAVYSGARFGAYDSIKKKMGETPDGPPLAIWQKTVAGLTAGAFGAVIGSPADITLVRMQADGKLPIAQRRNYRNVFHGLSSIVKEEGVRSLWLGSSTAVVRAMIVTASQLAAYDQIKETLINDAGLADSPPTHMLGGFLAGFVAACTSNPVDVVKTRIMNMRPGEYSGPIDCLRKTVKHEGPMALYKGFAPTFARQAPFVVVTFLTLEQIKRFWQFLDNRDGEGVQVQQAAPL